MSAIHDLIAQVSDPRLRERLYAEWAAALQDKKFGLVFEDDHLPENGMRIAALTIVADDSRTMLKSGLA